MEMLYTNDKGETTKYTEDMLINALKARDLFDKENVHLTETISRLNNEIATIRGAVYDFFNEDYQTGTSEITCSVDDVNRLLDEIGSIKLKNLYTVRATIDVTISGVEAESEDAAEFEVQQELTAEWGSTEGEIDEYTVDIRRVEAE